MNLLFFAEAEQGSVYGGYEDAFIGQGHAVDLINLVKYPYVFTDGILFQARGGTKERYITDKEKEWAGLLLRFVDAAMAEIEIEPATKP